MTRGASGPGAAAARRLAGRGVEIDATFTTERAAHGQEWVLINCTGTGNTVKTAGRDKAAGAVRHSPLLKFNRIVQINFLGTLRYVAKSAAGMLLPDLLADGERDAVANSVSVAADDGQMTQAAHVASKADMVRMTLPIARGPMGASLRINVIRSGIFATPLLDGAAEKAKSALAASVALPKRLGDPLEDAPLAEIMPTIASAL